jgi:hypothetical protein
MREQALAVSASVVAAAFVATFATAGCAADSTVVGDDGTRDDDASEDEGALAPARLVGINLPPKRGTSNAGAFSTSALPNTYSRTEVQNTFFHRNTIRIAINPPTVADATAWTRTRQMVDDFVAVGGAAILCLWDSDANDDDDGHGDGVLDDAAEAQAMWQTVADEYASNSNVFFEALNEPFGYTDAADYVDVMKDITASLPQERVIIDGLGYASDVQRIAPLWSGLLGYHVYPNWLPAGQRTQSNYSNMVQRALRDVAGRTVVTEFGANTHLNEDYERGANPSENVAFLRGLDDAFGVMKPKGTLIWHGWNNGDSYSFWGATASARAKVDAVQAY